MIHRAFGEAFHAISASDVKGHFDSRLPGNIAVESKNGAIFIYSSELAERILFNRDTIAPSLLTALGNPEIAVIFCHYDVSESFGYVILENGVPTRSRMHTEDKTNDEGAPKEFELPWLQAESFIEEEGEPPAYRNTETGQTSTEAYVTAHMLDVVMQAFFGVCPWDEWNYKSEFNYYQRKLPAEIVKQTAEKAWWRFW